MPVAERYRNRYLKRLAKPARDPGQNGRADRPLVWVGIVLAHGRLVLPWKAAPYAGLRAPLRAPADRALRATRIGPERAARTHLDTVRGTAPAVMGHPCFMHASRNAVTCGNRFAGGS